MSMKEELIEKIQNKTLTMGVCGLGYVGLPLAVDKAKHGFRTIGFDVQQEKVNMVNAGKNYIGDVVDADLEKLVKAGMLSATTDFSRVCDVDFIAICVPTPLDKHQQPDISYVRDSTIAISKHLRRGSMVVLESTTYPGTTEELIRPILEEGNGLKCGEDFYLGFSPERVDPGNLIYKTSNTPKVVGAIGADATEVISMVYHSILDGDVTTVSSPAVAEMEKILENTYRNVNIGLINELAILCNKMGIDIWEVVDAAKTKPYGFQAFYPGPGLGGHCIPLDPYYLSWKAREYGFHTSMIEASMMVGAALAGASEAEIKVIEDSARDIGLAFQIRDDILDVTSTTDELGKPVFSDEKNDKTTYVTIEGIEKAKSDVEEISKRAVSALQSLGRKNDFLEELVLMLVNRKK